MGSGSKFWTLYGLAATGLATIAAHKTLSVVWKISTGKPPPKNPAHPDVSIGQAVAMATFSGAAVGLARMVATRQAASYFRKSTGHLPANLQDVDG